MNPLASGTLALAAAFVPAVASLEPTTLVIEPPPVALDPGSIVLGQHGDAPGPRRIPTRSEREQLAAKRKAAKSSRRRNR